MRPAASSSASTSGGGATSRAFANFPWRYTNFVEAGAVERFRKLSQGVVAARAHLRDDVVHNLRDRQRLSEHPLDGRGEVRAGVVEVQSPALAQERPGFRQPPDHPHGRYSSMALTRASTERSLYSSRLS